MDAQWPALLSKKSKWALMMKFNSERSVFTSGSDEVLSAELLFESNEQFSVDYSNFYLSHSYWDVSFKFYFIDEKEEKIDVLLVLTNKSQSIEMVPPNFLDSDYFNRVS
jgi:hypothetical protein